MRIYRVTINVVYLKINEKSYILYLGGGGAFSVFSIVKS